MQCRATLFAMVLLSMINAPLVPSGANCSTQVYKPGSVLTAIYLAPQLLTGSSRLLGTVGQTLCSSTALLRDRVYSTDMSPYGEWALTPLFHYDR